MSREKAPAASECLAYSIYLPLCCCCCCFGERSADGLHSTITYADYGIPLIADDDWLYIKLNWSHRMYIQHTQRESLGCCFSLSFFYSAKTFEWKCCTLRRYKYKIHTAQPTIFFYFRFVFPLVYPRSEGLGLSLSNRLHVYGRPLSSYPHTLEMLLLLLLSQGQRRI